MLFQYFLHHREGRCGRAGNWLQADNNRSLLLQCVLAAGTSLNKTKQMQGKQNMTVKRFSLKMKQPLNFVQRNSWFDLISKLCALLNVYEILQQGLVWAPAIHLIIKL